MFLCVKRRLKRRNAWFWRFKQRFKHRNASGFGVFDIYAGPEVGEEELFLGKTWKLNAERNNGRDPRGGGTLLALVQGFGKELASSFVWNFMGFRLAGV